MDIKFRCNFCGKNLKIDESIIEVQCPHCKNIFHRELNTDNNEQQEEKSDVFYFLSEYIPSWGTSLVMHLSLVLVVLMSCWVSVKDTNNIEYTSEIKIQKKINVNNSKKEVSRSVYKKTDISPDYAYKISKIKSTDIVDYKSNVKLDTIGIIGGNSGIGENGISSFGIKRRIGDGDVNSWFDEIGNNNAKNIVFVIDKSGSMTDTISYVKNEIRKSIKNMSPSQKFYILFYSSGPSAGMPSGKLIYAIEQNKLSAYEFIDSTVASGQTDPSDALRNAFKMSPDVIHLLTDGEFDKSIVSLIDNLNKDKKISVNTYCFVYSPGEEMLKEIARRNNGLYKFISESDFMK